MTVQTAVKFATSNAIVMSKLYLVNTSIYDQGPAKLITSPSTSSANLCLLIISTQTYHLKMSISALSLGANLY